MDRLLGDTTAEEFAWSPDGRRFAYHSRAGGRWEIRVSSG
jgi:Tol biopolymer transport system component